jgi:hypothetical protein
VLCLRVLLDHLRREAGARSEVGGSAGVAAESGLRRVGPSSIGFISSGGRGRVALACWQMRCGRPAAVRRTADALALLPVG